jgi:hypothetical protein
MSHALFKSLHALATLGLALVRHVMVGAPWRASAPRWLGRLLAEDLAATPKTAWELYESAWRCSGCGVCEAVLGEAAGLSGEILALARRPQDAPACLGHAARLRQAAPAVAEVCPNKVDLLALAALLEAQAAQLSPPPGVRSAKP